MKNEVLKLLNEYSYQKHSNTSERVIEMQDFSDVAEEIVKLFAIPVVVGRSEQLVCDVCGSNDVIEAPHMGRNCNRCHPL